MSLSDTCLAATITTEPQKMPFRATEENQSRTEKWIKEFYTASVFNTCEHQELQKMAGPPLKVTFHHDVEPVAVRVPATVPHHWKMKVKAGVDRNINLGIIETVLVGTPMTWCLRMVVAAKHDGSSRQTVDLQEVNKATMRETHHTPFSHDLVVGIPAKQYKTVLDCWNGYHSLKVTEDSRDAMTFLTEWGQFRYRRAPQGFHASGDGYTRRMDEIVTDVVDYKKCINDTILYKPDQEQIFWHTMK